MLSFKNLKRGMEYMKGLISTALLAVALFSSGALAFEGSMHIDANGSVQLIPIQRDCSQPQPQSMQPTQNCNPETAGCPSGYHMASKYCWGGWHRGFYNCGSLCVIDAHGATAPGGDRESRH